MKRFVMTIVLTFSLAGVALAGDVPSVGITATEPDGTPTTTATAPAPGEIPSVGYTDQMSDATLNLIQMMVGLVV